MYDTCRNDFAIKRGPLIATKKRLRLRDREPFHCKLMIFICLPPAVETKACSRN